MASSEIFPINRGGGPICGQRPKACNLLLGLKGEITDAMVAQMSELISRTQKAAGREKAFFAFGGVELDSPGGDVQAAMALGRLLRKLEGGAWVNRGARCLSSCVLVLAGATARSFEGQIGIHRPYFLVPRGDVSSQAVASTLGEMLRELREYFREMNVSEQFADAMLRIPPERIKLLREEDLAGYGITPVDPFAQEGFDLQRAKSLGLDRQEYMKRKLLAEQRCGGPSSIGSKCYEITMKSRRTTEPVDFSKFGRPAE
jgi:hypothetical protein